MKDTLIRSVTSAGEVLLTFHGRSLKVHRKENLSSIVTEADVASENHILETIRERFPTHNLLAEESGFQRRDSEYTWVIDPLDGTSNFAAGLPWFGVMGAVLRGKDPILGALYLPLEKTLYWAERGKGAWCNDRPLKVSTASDLKDVLCSYALDSCADAALCDRQVRLYRKLVNRVRNLRSTNCLFDFVYTIDGRLGAAVNHATRIWDIAAILLVLQEAGGVLVDLDGRPITLSLDAQASSRNYAVVGGNASLTNAIAQMWSSCQSP